MDIHIQIIPLKRIFDNFLSDWDGVSHFLKQLALRSHVRSAHIVIQHFLIVKHDDVPEVEAVIGKDLTAYDQPLTSLFDQENLFRRMEAKERSVGVGQASALFLFQ